MERHQITGHTELIGLLAYPIRHSQSPATHNAAYEKLGVDIVNLAFEVDAPELEDAIKGLRALKTMIRNIFLFFATNFIEAERMLLPSFSVML